MSRRIAVVVWVTIALWCVGVTCNTEERTVRLINSGSIDLDEAIDKPRIKLTLTASGDREGIRLMKRERESDFEREKRREMEVAREREQERNNHQGKEQTQKMDEKLRSSGTSDIEMKKESDRLEEITREINKAEERKKAILEERGTHERLINKSRSARNNKRNNRTEPSSQRQIDRALRGGDAPERVESKLVRDTLHEDGRDDWTHSESKAEHRNRHQEITRRKPPILIIEQIPVIYTDSAISDHHPETHFNDRHKDGYNDANGSSLPENDRRFESSRRGKPHIDHRAPDRPVALPRPHTAYTDRRPDRPDYPYRYDEIHINISGNSAKYQTELFDGDHIDHTVYLPPIDDLSHDQGFHGASVVHSSSLDLHSTDVLPHHVPDLGVAHANAANTQLALEQALITKQTLHAQAIQAEKIKQAAVAHLVGQAAAQQLAAQQVAAQLIAAGSASARHKAAQLGRIIVGNAAIKAAIKTKLEHEAGHRLKKLISQNPAGEVFSDSRVDVQLGVADVTTPLPTNNFQQHYRLLTGNVDQIREDLIYRLMHLK